MMSSLSRLSSTDCLPLGATMRFNLLSNNAVSPIMGGRNASCTSLHALPVFESLDADAFLNMFDVSDDNSPLTNTSQHNLPQHLHSPLPELSGASTTKQYNELSADSVMRSELAANSTPVQRRSGTDTGSSNRTASGQISYRSSVTSSNPSTKRSNASSRRSRRSSMSSMTEDCSSSERSSKESDKENALHQRLKRRSQEKRVSFSGRTTQLRFRPSSESNFLDTYTAQQPQLQTTLPTSFGPAGDSPRSESRGVRLGLAMADGLATSPPPTPTTLDPHFRQLEGYAQINVLKARSASRDSSCSGRSERMFSTGVVSGIDRVRVGIMSHLDSIADLKACAQVSKDFYNAFHRYETLLVDCVLYKQSKAAWELRHSVRHLEKPSPFRLRSVQKDYSTVYALEDFVVWRCQSVLRPQSLEAFLGTSPRRKAELEDAIWMVWTFCNVFGKTARGDPTLAKQTQWLNAGPKRVGSIVSKEGFKIRPCSMRELEDMSEIWRCLEALLAGFKGKEAEARQAGLFDSVGQTKLSDSDLLSLWVYDILSLGPKAVLTLSSCDFEQAKVLGITKWTPPAKGKSRTNFLKAAVEEVYRDRLMKDARKKAMDYRRNVQHNHKRTISDPSHFESQHAARARVPVPDRNPLRVNTQYTNQPPRPHSAFVSNREPAQIRPDCDPLSTASINQGHLGPVLSPSTNPTAFSPLVMTKNASTRLGATLFPMQNRDQSQRYSIPVAPTQHRPASPEPVSGIDVIDPADRAVALLVYDMGFSEHEAKRALALSDSGSGINVEAAIEMLSAGQTVKQTPRRARLSELPAAVGDAKLSRRKSQREVCEGHCKPMLLVEPKRDRVTGLGMVKRGLSTRMSFRRSNRLSVIMDDEDNSPATSNLSGSRNSTLRVAKDTKRGSAVTQLANTSISTFASPAMRQFDDAMESGIAGRHSPVSPITPHVPDWLKPDMNPIADARSRDTFDELSQPPKPRIILQKVGTGTRKQGWGLPGKRRKDVVTQPEIIGYAY